MFKTPGNEFIGSSILLILQLHEEMPYAETADCAADFKERQTNGGHSDFEKRPQRGFGLYCRNIGENLDADGCPIFIDDGRRHHKIIFISIIFFFI